MKLYVDHLYTYIEGTHPKQIFDKVAAYKVHGYWFSTLYKKGHWDGYYRFTKYDRSKKQYYFPTGFLGTITAELDKADYPYELFDERAYDHVEPCFELFNEPNPIQLNVGKYDYQGEGLCQLISHGRGILQIATGGGKTEVAAALIKSIGKKTVWLTHRGNLLEQTRERLAYRLQRKIGAYGYGYAELQDVTIMMAQTLGRLNHGDHVEAMKWLKDVEVIIGDEVHHLESGEWYAGFSKIPARWRYGLSATPRLKGDGLSLIAMTGNVVYKISAWDLIDRGVLIPPRIWFGKYESDGLKKGLPYQSLYKQGVVQNINRNALIKRMALQMREEAKSTLVLVRRIYHGEHLTDLLADAGLKCAFLYGSSSTRKRKDTIAKLEAGEIDTVVAQVELFGEGADIPSLRAVINAVGTRGGGNSKEEDGEGKQTIQILGRGLRRHPGKTTFDYFDFVDTAHTNLIYSSYDRVMTLEEQGYGPCIQYWDEYEPSS